MTYFEPFGTPSRTVAFRAHLRKAGGTVAKHFRHLQSECGSFFFPSVSLLQKTIGILQ